MGFFPGPLVSPHLDSGHPTAHHSCATMGGGWQGEWLWTASFHLRTIIGEGILSECVGPRAGKVRRKMVVMWWRSVRLCETLGLPGGHSARFLLLTSDPLTVDRGHVKCPPLWRQYSCQRATDEISFLCCLCGFWEGLHRGTQGPGTQSPTISFLLFLCDWMSCINWQLERKWRNCSLPLKHYGKMTREWNNLMRNPFPFTTPFESRLVIYGVRSSILKGHVSSPLMCESLSCISKARRILLSKKKNSLCDLRFIYPPISPIPHFELEMKISKPNYFPGTSLWTGNEDS